MIFKGDTVELIDNSGMNAVVGCLAKVTSHEILGIIQVEWIMSDGLNGQSDGGYMSDRFELKFTQTPTPTKDIPAAKTYTAEQMIEFANMFTEKEYITKDDLETYHDVLKQREDKEYKLYLELKSKYE